MPSVGFLDFKDKKILYLDFSGCTFEKLTKMIAGSIELIGKQQENSLLVLINVKDAPADTGISSLVKSYAGHNKRFIKAAAIIGINDKTKLILEKAKEYSGQEISVFETADEAKEWLVQQ